MLCSIHKSGVNKVPDLKEKAQREGKRWHSILWISTIPLLISVSLHFKLCAQLSAGATSFLGFTMLYPSYCSQCRSNGEGGFWTSLAKTSPCWTDAISGIDFWTSWTFAKIAFLKYHVGWSGVQKILYHLMMGLSHPLQLQNQFWTETEKLCNSHSLNKTCLQHLLLLLVNTL